MDKAPVNVDLLFETSWEVCNKIGGIYTVLSTKAKTLQKLYKDKTIFIGPDVWNDENPSPYFVPSRTLLKDWKAQAQFPEGVSVRVGRWDIPGRPIVVLVKFDGMYAVKDSFYGRMWDLYKVDSLHAYGDYDEACAFSHAAGIVIESICQFTGIADKKVIAHFDEWTTGMGLLYINDKMPEVGTIFTTHATCIGRSICGNGKPLYDYLRGYNGDQMASELNMQSKHSLEKAAALQADCFTTVSDITAIECEQLLERRPLVTPNGFEQNFVPTKGKFVPSREAARKTLLNVASSLLGYKMPDDTFIIATSGRCEYHNKGIDLYLDSIARLRENKLSRTVLAFVMVPAWAKEARPELQAALTAKRKSPIGDSVLTHTLNNPDQDPINCRIRGIGFANAKADNVKVIYVPCYLNGSDGIFDKTYYDLLIGMDATVFPSYYEPWGYTPLESIAFGVPTITTTLSGFGQWILSTEDATFSECGVNVVARGDFNYNEVADRIAKSLEYLINSNPASLAMISSRAMNTASLAAWSYFIEYYVKAFEVALNAAAQRIGK
ncbi:glycosyltransferase [Muribaculum gordoncarteri]|jgi:glycosyltransferase involved in cell wall biosynthesis|uniref:Glycosyltransferase n=13 Tax=Muribaculum TaxID=1918540 RepID=A0A4P7VNB4_9BACT|nr:glycosyltransferase [Muribaculum gordoncarteri]QCD35215.1 glycosyltransferase [Muribaculum gordoncarteri]